MAGALVCCSAQYRRVSRTFPVGCGAGRAGTIRSSMVSRHWMVVKSVGEGVCRTTRTHRHTSDTASIDGTTGQRVMVAVAMPSDSSLSVVLARLVSASGCWCAPLLPPTAGCALSVCPPSGSPRRRTYEMNALRVLRKGTRRRGSGGREKLSNPSDASSSWQPATRHNRTLSGTSIAPSPIASVAFDGNWATTCRMTPMISSAISAPCTSFESACSVVGERPSSACRLAEHWDSRSSGSLCGKNTLDGIPLAAGSNRNPTAISRSFQPLTGPALLSMLFCVALLHQVQANAQRVPAFVRRAHQLAQCLPDQCHLIRQAHVAADQDEAGPVGRMREVFRVLHRLHRLGKRLRGPRALQQRRVERAQQDLGRRLRHRPERHQHRTGAREQPAAGQVGHPATRNRLDRVNRLPPDCVSSTSPGLSTTAPSFQLTLAAKCTHSAAGSSVTIASLVALELTSGFVPSMSDTMAASCSEAGDSDQPHVSDSDDATAVALLQHTARVHAQAVAHIVDVLLQQAFSAGAASVTFCHPSGRCQRVGRVRCGAFATLAAVGDGCHQLLLFGHRKRLLVQGGRVEAHDALLGLKEPRVQLTPGQTVVDDARLAAVDRVEDVLAAGEQRLAVVERVLGALVGVGAHARPAAFGRDQRFLVASQPDQHALERLVAGRLQVVEVGARLRRHLIAPDRLEDLGGAFHLLACAIEADRLRHLLHLVVDAAERETGVRLREPVGRQCQLLLVVPCRLGVGLERVVDGTEVTAGPCLQRRVADAFAQLQVLLVQPERLVVVAHLLADGAEPAEGVRRENTVAELAGDVTLVFETVDRLLVVSERTVYPAEVTVRGRLRLRVAQLVRHHQPLLEADERLLQVADRLVTVAEATVGALLIARALKRDRQLQVPLVALDRFGVVVAECVVTIAEVPKGACPVVLGRRCAHLLQGAELLLQVPDCVLVVAHVEPRDAQVAERLRLHGRVLQLLGSLQLLLVALDGVRVVPERHVDRAEVPMSPTLPGQIAHLLAQRQLLRVVAQGLVELLQQAVGEPEGPAGSRLHAPLARLSRQCELALVHLDRLVHVAHADQHVANVAERAELARQVVGHVRDRQEVLLALERTARVAERQVREPEVAVRPAHVHLVLQVLGERQILVVVPHRLPIVADAVVRVAEEMARLPLRRHVAQLLRQHQVLLVVRHRLRELLPRAETVAEVEQGARLTRRVLQLARNVQVRPVVHQRHVVRAQRLVRDGQVAVRGRLRAPIVHLLADDQLLLVVLDRGLVVAGGRVRVADVAVRAAHARLVLQLAGDREVRLVQLEGRIVLAQQLIDDAQVGAGAPLAHLVAGRERHLELLLVPPLRLHEVVAAAGRMPQPGVRPRLDRPVAELLRDPQHALVVRDGLREVALVVVARAEVAVGARLLHLVAELARQPQVLRVAVDGRVELAHRQVDRADVADLARLLQPVAHLLHQLHALLVRGERVRIVADRGVHVPERGERGGRRLRVLALHRQHQLVAVRRERLLAEPRFPCARHSPAVSPRLLATARSCCMYAIALSSWLSAQCAELSAENTEPRSFSEQEPMRSADSSTVTAAWYWPAPSSSCPTTEITTNGDWSSFIAFSCWKVGSSACRSGLLIDASTSPASSCLLFGSCASPALNAASASPYRPRHCSATPCRKYAFGHWGQSSRARVASWSASANWPCLSRAADRLL
uniref:Uncharacterized protein n=1 Tax=Anopheles atroparvus TaxID=41427 RepID=A0A182JDH6_ANOAO